jgi:tetratricopeptide (TPR) repeat protein
VSQARLYLSHDPGLDWLVALRFGSVDDGQPPSHWRGVSASFGFLHDGPAGEAPEIGFKVKDFSEFDPDAAGLAELWEGPRFVVPQLGLESAPAGEIVLAARSHFGTAPSLNRALFNRATTLGGEPAVDAWRACLQAGDCMAHFALGYTLHELGRHREAYRHLRYYAMIAPAHPWNHCWYGRAAQAIGELGEARAAYRRAIELTAAGAEPTDAPELLAALEADRR